jgi:hypothetical protein
MHGTGRRGTRAALFVSFRLFIRLAHRLRGASDRSRTRLVQLHERLHEQLHNFSSQTTSSMPSSLASFSENSLSQS